MVFVCRHNSARSPLAAALWTQRTQRPAASAGTQPAPRVHPKAVAVAHRHGLRLDPAGTAHVYCLPLVAERIARQRLPGLPRHPVRELHLDDPAGLNLPAVLKLRGYPTTGGTEAAVAASA